MVSNADVSLDFNLASFFVSPIFEFFNTIAPNRTPTTAKHRSYRVEAGPSCLDCARTQKVLEPECSLNSKWCNLQPRS